MIERVWGKADNFEIEFRAVDGNWEFVGLPPDLEDGQYAVELHATKDSGVTGSWAGILYMMQGVATLCICRRGTNAAVGESNSVLQTICGSTELQISRPVMAGRCKCD